MEKIKQLVENEYSILEKYINSYTKILIKHNKCGYEWKIKPNSFLNDKRCPKCSQKLHYTTESFKEKVYELTKNEYEVLGNYKNNYTKILIKHNKCDYEWYVTPHSFLSGHRCPKCAGLLFYTTESFKEKVKELSNDTYEVLGEYINNKTKIKIRHKICSYIWDVSPGQFLHKLCCPKCAKNIKRTTEQFKQEVYNLVGNEYEVLGEYKNRHKKILIKHNYCNHIYEVQPNHFLHGRRCPICSKNSKGEFKIKKYLTENNFDFKEEYTFNDCKNKMPLQFDFIVYLNNNKFILIEFDGLHHYEPIERFGGVKTLEYTQQNDQIKNDYCKQNNIPLLRIPYWEYNNIEQILKNYLFN